MADLDLALRLTADGDDLRGEVRLSKAELEKLANANEEVGRSGRNAGKGLDEGGRGAQSFRNKARELNRTGGRLGRTLRSLARVAGTVAGVFGGISLGVLLSDMTQTIFLTERLTGTLLTATGGMQNLADQAFVAIEAFASRTPFALQQSIEAFIQMQNLGIRPTEERLTGFGNTAAAMGRGLNQMIEAVADAATGEFERLKEFGIKARQKGEEVALTFRGVTTNVRNESEAIVQYLTNIGTVDFAGAMETQMERLPGLLSNLKDNIDGIWRDLGAAGITAMFATWLGAGIEWTDNIRDVIQSGWFTWLGAELAVLQARFGGWWDVARDAVSGYVVYFRAQWETIFSLFTGDNSLERGFTSLWESVQNITGFIAESVATLPVNVKALAAIAFGEAVKFTTNVIENFQLLKNSGARVWEDLRFTTTSVLLSMKQSAAETVESIIQSFGSLVTQLGQTLDAINSTALGDALVPDDALARIQAAGAAMQNYQGLSAGIAAEVREASAAHRERVAALEAERAGIEAAAENRREAADEFIAAALADRDATLEARDARIQDAEAAAAAAKSAYEQNRALKTLAPTIDDVTEKLGHQGDGQGKVNQALEKLLDELEPARRILRDYEANLQTLTEALANGEINQEQFNAALGRLRDNAEEALGATGGLVEELRVVWERSLERMDDIGAQFFRDFIENGKISMDSVTQLFQDMLAEMAYAAARNAILVQIGTTDGTGLGGVATSLLSGTDTFSSLFTGQTVATQPAATGVVEGAATTAAAAEASGAGLAGIGSAASLAWAALAVGVFRTLDDLQSGRYGLGDALSGNNLNIKYSDGSLLGDAIFPKGENIEAAAQIGFDPFFAYRFYNDFEGGTGQIINNLVGFKDGGNNAARGSFDLATGRTDSFGVGKNFSERNLDAVDQFLELFLDYAASIGGSEFDGNIKVGSRSGFAIDGEKFKTSDEFIAEIFQSIIEEATNLNAEVQALLLERGGDAETVGQNTQDAQLLNRILRQQNVVFEDVDGFTETFNLLVDQFRREAEGFVDVFERFELGLAIMEELGKSTERTVDNLQAATDLVDDLGLEVARGLASVFSSLGDGVRAQMADIQEEALRTNIDIYQTQVAQQRDLLAGYDGTAESIYEIANANAARRESEIALLTELDQVAGIIQARISSFREELVLGGLDEQGQYERYRGQIADLGSQLATAGSASQIDRIQADIDRLARTAFNVLDEDQQDINRQGFLDWLDELEAAANARLQQLGEDVIDTSEDLDAETRIALYEQQGLAGENLLLAGESLQAAGSAQATGAQEMQGAAASVAGAGDSLDNASATLEQTVASLQTVVNQLAARLAEQEADLV